MPLEPPCSLLFSLRVSLPYVTGDDDDGGGGGSSKGHGKRGLVKIGEREKSEDSRLEQRSWRQDDEKKATKEGKRGIDRGWLKKDVVGKMRRGRVQLPKAEANSSTSDDKVSTLKSRIQTDLLSFSAISDFPAK
ncbi:hypothetical protein K0M31_020071 [Melipona bicolor]|uniref:Uncharacterized protein n=1 Tax=Melipona bicolor TaxID=60889 RepID=A0AA40KQL2_9HYME|nr:hypothetical protein K0M31_020071 [Melipona bicolor]